MNIVVIDDEPAIAQLIAEILTGDGHDPSVFHSLDGVPDGHSAALVISDLLPLTDFSADRARVWVRALGARFPGAAIVLCTAHLEALRQPDGLGAAAIIAKPFDVDHLSETVRRLVS